MDSTSGLAVGLARLQGFRYRGPSQALKRIATAVSAQGAVLPINPPSANATWSSSFRGPALRCDSIPLAEHDAIYQNILEYTNNTAENCQDAGGYVTWDADLPYKGHGSRLPMVETTRPFSPGNATFHVAVLPALASYLRNTVPAVCNDRQNISLASLPPNLLNNSTLLQCRLVNATYHAEFDYTNGNQTVSVDAPRTPLDTVTGRVIDIYGPSTNENSCAELHGSTMDAKLSPENYEPCRIQSQVLQRVAYQSIMEAFLNVISGPVSRGDFGFKGNILSTTLLETSELAHLTDYARAHEPPLYGVHPNLHIAIGVDAGRADIAGLSEPDPTAKRLSLADGLEQMFQNLTVSLMSSPVFQ
jgi:hypothetical protein